MTVRKSRSNPIPGLSVKLRKTNPEPGFKNYWLPSYFVKNEPAFLRKKIKFFINKFFGLLGLVIFLWLAGGSAWVGNNFFNSSIKKVFIEGEHILNEIEVLKTSKLYPGQLLSNIIPYKIAEELQKHPAIQKADIRKKFPDEIHLFLNEYKPVAILKIFNSQNYKGTSHSLKNTFFLIGDHQRVIKKIPLYQILTSNYAELPLISGLKLNSLQMGSFLNSAVLERGLGFLKTFRKIKTESQEKELENFFLDQKKLANLYYKSIHIDISDPLNLKISWPEKNSRFKSNHHIYNQKLPVTVQIGSRKFDERLRTFQNIYPVLYKKHPSLKSIDLRYKNKVMLTP
tara:strand:+ start:279 stop:1304 length:1026 start_codon:yes stop_codon:yes gene_type:complete